MLIFANAHVVIINAAHEVFFGFLLSRQMIVFPICSEVRGGLETSSAQ